MVNKIQGTLKTNKKRVIVIGILVVLLIAIIGFSYAWLRTVIVGKEDVQIIVGDLDLVLDESSTNGIQLTNAIPAYDDEGKTYEPYVFSLKNQSNIDIYYTLSLVDDEELISSCKTTSGGPCELLDPRDIRYEIKMGDRTFTGSLSDSSIINYGIIGKGETIQGELRVWLNINATNESMGKVFLGQLRVFGTQQLDSSDFEQGTDAVNEPAMDSNMIAVKHDGYNWVKTDTTDGWYNYDMGIWANAVTVKSDKLSTYQAAPVGTEINMDDIETMWVWIPRYSYTIAGSGSTYYGKRGVYLDSEPTATLPGEIDIKFIGTEEKDTGTARYTNTEAPKNWYTPDAFTFGDQELSGIWVGKFETSNTTQSSTNSTTPDPITKPNVSSWRSINVSNIYNVGLKVSAAGNRYGFSENMNSHAMKNDEWAAVAYLSQSRYGKLGNVNFTGANKEIYQNKSNSFITGCSYGSPSNGNTDYGCQYTYDSNIRTEDGSTGRGVGASTTGTIYGVYDMSGGAWEYVMANYNDTIASSGFEAMPDSIYYNKYTSSDINTACNGGVCTSHGLSETAGWYNDYRTMVTEQYPWLLRGGGYGNNTGAGVFYLHPSTSAIGGALSYGSFRLVMSVTSP